MSRPDDPVVARWPHRRWRGLLALTGRAATARPVQDRDPAVPVARHDQRPAAGRQLDLREQFVRAGPAEQRGLDLLCVAMVDRGDDGELIAFSPQAMRAQTVPTESGLVVGELRLGPATGVSRVSVLVLRLPRHPRCRGLAASIDNLGRALDYPRDATGSAAVADLLLYRVESLMSVPGVGVALSGTVGVADDDGHYTYRLLAASDGADVHVRDGRTMITEAGGQVVPWRAANFALLRAGPPRPARDEIRSIHQLRQEHALVEIGFGPGEIVAEAESWSARAARTRQALRAADLVRSVLSGDSANAREIYGLALSQPELADSFAEDLGRRVDNAADFWSVDDLLGAAVADPELPAGARAAAARISERFGLRLNDLLEPPGDPFAKDFRPIIFEVSDALVPAVDDNQDGGAFLTMLDKQVRERIRTETGIVVPGIRVRGAPDLSPGHFRIQVDANTVFEGQAVPAPDALYAVTPYRLPVPDQYQVTDVDPLTHRRGARIISGGPVDPSVEDHLSTSQYLAYHLESVLRAHLHCFVGPQEVVLLLEQWVADDESAAPFAPPGDRDERMRLTWILHDLVAEGLSVADWRTILAAVHVAGGFRSPAGVLGPAVRACLRAAIRPVAVTGVPVRVPAEYDATLLTTAEGGRQFLRWLTATAEEHGPAITLVTGTEDVRDLVAVLGRAPHRLVTAYTEAELAPS